MIEFLCPNNHKIRCPDDQAGRAAKCPKCGVKFLIPSNGTAEKVAVEKEASSGQSTNMADSHISLGSFRQIASPGKVPSKRAGARCRGTGGEMRGRGIGPAAGAAARRLPPGSTRPLTPARWRWRSRSTSRRRHSTVGARRPGPGGEITERSPTAGSRGAPAMVTIAGLDSLGDADALALTFARAVVPASFDRRRPPPRDGRRDSRTDPAAGGARARALVTIAGLDSPGDVRAGRGARHRYGREDVQQPVSWVSPGPRRARALAPRHSRAGDRHPGTGGESPHGGKIAAGPGRRRPRGGARRWRRSPGPTLSATRTPWR